MFNLVSVIHVIVNWQLSKKGIYLSEFENVTTRFSPSAGLSPTQGQCGLQTLTWLNLGVYLGRHSWIAQGLPQQWVGGPGLAWGGGGESKTSGESRGLFDTTLSVCSSVSRLEPCFSFTRANSIRPLLTVIIVIIAELYTYWKPLKWSIQFG